MTMFQERWQCFKKDDNVSRKVAMFQVDSNECQFYSTMLLISVK